MDSGQTQCQARLVDVAWPNCVIPTNVAPLYFLRTISISSVACCFETRSNPTRPTLVHQCQIMNSAWFGHNIINLIKLIKNNYKYFVLTCCGTERVTLLSGVSAPSSFSLIRFRIIIAVLLRLAFSTTSTTWWSVSDSFFASPSWKRELVILVVSSSSWFASFQNHYYLKMLNYKIITNNKRLSIEYGFGLGGQFRGQLLQRLRVSSIITQPRSNGCRIWVRWRNVKHHLYSSLLFSLN